jgi:Fe-S-cluster containining protein
MQVDVNRVKEISEQTEVPCQTCTECCRSGQGLFLHPDRGDDVQSYRFQVLTDAATGNETYLLATTPAGACVYLGPSGCTIYHRRPLLCRTFDCRKHYLILPRQDRDNLVKLGLSSRAVFNAGRARLKTLTAEEREDCLSKREEFFS